VHVPAASAALAFIHNDANRAPFKTRVRHSMQSSHTQTHERRLPTTFQQPADCASPAGTLRAWMSLWG
jgi:hypothetical protein